MRCSPVETRWMLAGEPSALNTSASTTIRVSAVASSPKSFRRAMTNAPLSSAAMPAADAVGAGRLLGPGVEEAGPVRDNRRKLPPRARRRRQVDQDLVAAPDSARAEHLPF